MPQGRALTNLHYLDGRLVVFHEVGTILLRMVPLQVKSRQTLRLTAASAATVSVSGVLWDAQDCSLLTPFSGRKVLGPLMAMSSSGLGSIATPCDVSTGVQIYLKLIWVDPRQIPLARGQVKCSCSTLTYVAVGHRGVSTS